jgi:DNA polymerase epsilon subunit 4
MCSNNAAFVITLATVSSLKAANLSLRNFITQSANLRFPQEMFIQRLAEESHNQAKLDRKPRRNVQYKDVGTYSPLAFIPYPPPQGLNTSD